ncbi:hypothetical protein KDA_02120 [Dictyobacter alpinus]|uniref:Uncharacterized protein n=1 Tax=Dictyobacter alpinus TaxID=2014873 RepID=A0A402B072_9CHLR|nr:hypothetical protein [Dictyobacter alpinus]GCE24728.1 hypothetical protein KDA_02120 [Dictyobacter alpinus]
MRTSHNSWLPTSGRKKIIYSIGICTLALLILVIYHLALPPSTPQTAASGINPTITIEAGFENTYRSGYWTPVRVTIDNNGPAFDGKISVRTFSGSIRQQHIDTISPWSFEQPVTLAQGAEKRLTVYAPHYTGNLLTRGFLATLSNSLGQTISTQSSRQGYEVQPGDTLVGVLSDNEALEPQLAKLTLINQSGSLNVSRLDTRTLPTLETAMENFDVLILDNFATNTLSAQQLTILETWVNRGGILIEVGGLNWQRTLGPLPESLLPVTMQGLNVLPAQTHLLSFNGNTIAPAATDIPPVPPTISTATIHEQSAFSSIQTVFGTTNMPLLVQGHQGAGIICYLAFDLAAPPLNNWGTSSGIWQMLLQRVMGDHLLISSGAQSYDGGPGQILTRGGLINFLAPTISPLSLELIGLIIGYLLFLGPVRLWYLRKHPQARLQSWRIVLCGILVFSLLSYGVAASIKIRAVTNNSVSLIQINQNGTAAHATTYMGVLVPGQGDMNLQLPEASLAEPIDGQYLNRNASNPDNQTSMESTPTTVTYNPHNTDLKLYNDKLWSIDPIISEQDLTLQGKLSGHLTLQNNHVLGTVHNNLPTPLSDAYVLFPHTFIPLGHLAVGQTRTFDVLLKNIMPVSEQTLADQIGRQTGLPGQYFPYQQKKQPQTNQQQHMALLSALSGIGSNYVACEGSCLTHAITSKSTIYVTGGQIPDPNLKNDYDPLLIPGAQATLIAWSDDPLTAVSASTVNQQTPQGQHTSFLQMPLSMEYSGAITIPQDSITGTIIDIASYDAGAILPGAYTLSTGSLKFEIALPGTKRLAIKSLTITVPDLIKHPSGPGSGSSIHNGNIQARLYNWQSKTWEPINFTPADTFTTRQAEKYTGPYSRILIQVGNKSTAQIYFGKPLLSINGNVTP